MADSTDKKKEADGKRRKSFVDLNPRLRRINEERSTTQVDYAIRLGLGDRDHISYYRQVIKNPDAIAHNAMLRPYLVEVADKLLDIVFGDPQVWNRVKTLLQRGHKGPPMSEAAYASIVRRAARHGVDVEDLLEVYAAAGSEDEAFSRINSFEGRLEKREQTSTLAARVTRILESKK